MGKGRDNKRAKNSFRKSEPVSFQRFIKKYFENVDGVFDKIKYAIEKKKIYKFLKSPVAYSGFKRLT